MFKVLLNNFLKDLIFSENRQIPISSNKIRFNRFCSKTTESLISNSGFKVVTFKLRHEYAYILYMRQM